MNIIHKLQRNNQVKAEAIASVSEVIDMFRNHLNSSKFHVDTTIQVSDVHRWLDSIVRNMNDRLIEEVK